MQILRKLTAKQCMNIEKHISKLFLPDDESWLRHANPWPIWTRFATLPFILRGLEPKYLSYPSWYDFRLSSQNVVFGQDGLAV